MNALRLVFAVGLLPAAAAQGSEAMFDRVASALTFSSGSGEFRARLSGTVDLEAYSLQLPAPGVIQSTREELINPRLSVFLDAQLGPRMYAFAQARADRGFDPSDEETEVRLDEYALRFTPWSDGRLNVQLGKFATVVGNWAARHSSWTNPFITAPLPYEYLTGIWDTDPVPTSGVLLQWSHVRAGLPAGVKAIEKSLRVPIIWGPSYATGVSVAGETGRLMYAAEVKQGSLSSRPEAWHHGREQRHHPTVSTRVGWRPSPTWNFGVSASEGSYLREFAVNGLAAGHGRGDYRQRVVASDVAFAWRHVQLWGEVYASRFAIPGIGDADTAAWYVEAKYRFTPGFSMALRWNQQVFATIVDRGVDRAWGHDVWRLDAAPAFRFSAHSQLKLQYSLQHGDTGKRNTTRLLAAQLTVRF